MKKFAFEKAAPESVGINSRSIISFINRLKTQSIDMHSVLIMRDDKLIFEGYYAPFDKDTLHRMFSITKSVVSMAVGALADEGLINLDTSITHYFPEYEPKGGFHPYLKETTIRDMLSMTTPYNGTTFDKHKKNDWTETYFTSKPTHRPGTVFSYDTSASHVLTALVEKLTGKSLLDYIRGMGFDELGFSREAYCMTDACGVSMGGSGMMAKPRDVLLLAYAALNYGNVFDKQVLPEEYMKKATSHIVETFVKGTFIEESQGYGYMFWQMRHGGFMMYGMAGQFAFCFPKERLILVTTADETDRKDGVQQIADAFFDEILSRINDENRYDKNDYDELLRLEKSLKTEPLMNFKTRDMNETYYFDDDNPMGLDNIRIITSKSGGKLMINNKYGKQVVRFGFGAFLDGRFSRYDCPYIASGTFIGEDMLVVRAHLVGEFVGKVIMQLSFKKRGSLSVLFRKTEGTFFEEYSGFAQSVDVLE